MLGFTYGDDEIRSTIQKVYEKTGYLCDPHGACGYAALENTLKDNEWGIFLETAHPAKFTATMEQILGKGSVTLPEKLAAFMKGEKRVVQMDNRFDEFKTWLLKNGR